MRCFAHYLLVLGLAACLLPGCGRNRLPDVSSLRGVSLEQLQQMREDILSRHAGGSGLSSREAAVVEVLRAQERRLENSWIFGEWRDRHGARLIFRDDGTVSVGSRAGQYDEFGIYKYISPEQESYESRWYVFFDGDGSPVITIDTRDGFSLVYFFHDSRTDVRERRGDLLESSDTGFYFRKI